ncbi:hypothetical protein ACS5PU_24180 [Pedobacter sp. GSP4]|uniref:hypothetical protein n=1 Tax=Pedobacter sp. GSP4 TaxID=3453716 RepID=UPI003EEBF048
MLSRLLISFLFILLAIPVRAQNQKLDSVANNLNNYGLSKAQSGLFVHFDKNVYTNNDQVWFTAYLLKTVTDIKQYHTLYLSLINNKDSSVVLQDKFLMDKGFSFGSLTLPDSLPSGSYRFVTNTNLKINGQPDGGFVQPITIKSTTVTALTEQISIFKLKDQITGKGTVLLKVLSSDNRFVENAEIKYKIGRNKQVLQTGTARSSVIGELMIDYPADKITTENNLLFVSIKKGRDTIYRKFDLPVLTSPKYQVKFYPEGGYLVNGLLAKVGFEIKDDEGAAVKAKAVLFENGEILDTIGTNSMGMGTFMIQPASAKRYTVKLLPAEQQHISYNLPAALSSGIVLAAASSVADSTLKTRIEANINTKVHLLVHNFSAIFLQTALSLTANNAQQVRFKLDSVPAGLHTLTVLDSNYKPIAERIFFAHYDHINQVEIGLDKAEYLTRDSVAMKLKITDNHKAEVTGMVSISCVQANRILLANETNIMDYFYLKDDLNGFSNNSFGLSLTDRDYLNDLLLIKGWRRYKWPDAQLSEEANNKVLSSIDYSGVITKKKKPLNIPMGLTTIAGSNLNFINTDSVGHFNIPFSSLIIHETKLPVWLSMSTTKYDQYELKINNPQEEIKSYVIQQDFVAPVNKMAVMSENSLNITANSGIRLKEVLIRKTKDDRTDFAKNAYANSCGDYVCRYNILNCPNHGGDTNNRSPITGHSYADGRGGTIFYQGCTTQAPKPNFAVLKGINLPKEFYVSDVKNKNEPINFATVYWNYQALVEGDTPIKFNTGDLTGKFKVIVQGVTDTGVIYGEKEITVKAQ